uniref:HTH_38 domain-containing protein n=1 Tax=Heterorhabditis bacteriophora TaxID=37862 RepID=A0A1I7WJJ4_HETBA
MGRASTWSLHERDQIKVLSTTGYMVKQIADLNDRGKRTILRTASNRTTNIVGIRRACGIDASDFYCVRMPNKCVNIVLLRIKKFIRLT